MSASGILGINGMGRIGKLTLWHHLPGADFDRFVLNAGRDVGTSLTAVAEYLAKDSTYGPMHRYLDGHAGRPNIQVVDEAAGLLRVYGKEVRVLREARDPRDIPWREHGVRVVVDTTGVFKDPAAPADAPRGALRGHLEAGAKVVVLSAPFKSKGKEGLPPDTIMLIDGINQYQFDAGRHALVSAASCTTTALAHMMRPLLDRDVTRQMLTAGMSTVHATTNTQSVLDSVPASGAKDLRKSRSVLNNIILTSTGAARALELVMPEVGRIGFMADSVRIPTTTGSLIILNLTFQTRLTPDGRPSIDREVINTIYREAAEGEAKGLVRYTEEQNVSADIIGEDAAVVIEASETHTRTGFIHLQVPAGAGGGGETGGEGGEGGTDTEATPGASDVPPTELRIPVTHVKIFGWYDNEMGSYTGRLGGLTAQIARSL